MSAEVDAYLAPEAKARIEIDRMLEAAGWAVQDASSTNLSASRCVAVREFILAPSHGRADYLLFVDGRAVINDLANLAFISSKANRKISDRSPQDYFPEIGDDELRSHFVPLDEELRTADRYPDFVRARRNLLARAMTELLDDLAPASLTGAPQTEDPAAGERLIFNVYGESQDDPHAVVVLDASADGMEWRTHLPLRDLRFFVADLQNGFGSGLTIDGEAVDLESGAEASSYLLARCLREARSMSGKPSSSVR